MAHSTEQWVQWASMAGQRALLLYVGVLVLLVIAAAAGWWIWHRYAAHNNLTQAPPVMRMGLRGGLGFAVIVASSWIFVELAEGLGMQRSMGLADQALTDAIRLNVPIPVLQAFAAITRLGDTATLAGLCMVVAVALLLAGKRRFAFIWVLALAGNGVLNSVLKQIFARIRPLHEDGLVLASGFSFPSGHSSGAVVAYGMLAWLACQWVAKQWHLPIVLSAIALAYSVGVSRVFVQVHFASDVMAGFASGTAWLVVCVASLQLTSGQRTANMLSRVD
jgi:membrane-associated phospholipid phosphatase